MDSEDIEPRPREKNAQVRDWLYTQQGDAAPNVYSPRYTDKDRIRVTIAFLYDSGRLKTSIFNPGNPPNVKDASLCRKHTLAADHYGFLRKGKITLPNQHFALRTKAIAYAPNGSMELALAYERRALLLYRAALYVDCITDVDRYLQLPYPKGHEDRMISLKTNASLALQAWEEEQVGTSAAGTSKDSMKGNDDRFAPPVCIRNDEANLPQLGADTSRELPGASNSLVIVHSEKYGRHLLTTKKIHVGEILAIQRPYVSVLDLDKRFTNCWKCLKQTWSGIPCTSCVDVIYCSDQCRQRAWNQFHEIECPLMGPMLRNRFEAREFMSLRVLLKALREFGGWAQLMGAVDTISADSAPRTKGFTAGCFMGSKYASVYTLSNCTGTRAPENVFRLSISAATIACMLATMTNIFGQRHPLQKNVLLRQPFIVSAGILLLRHAEIHSVNAIEHFEWNSVDDRSEVRGMALIPFYGLINQNCNPSVISMFYGNTMVLHAIAPVEAGDQIFVHKGVTFVDYPLEERQQYHMNYGFKCECIACTAKWARFDDLICLDKLRLPKGLVVDLRGRLANQEKLKTTARSPSMSPLAASAYNLHRLFVTINDLDRLYEDLPTPCREIEEVKKTLILCLARSGSQQQSP